MCLSPTAISTFGWLMTLPVTMLMRPSVGCWSGSSGLMYTSICFSIFGGCSYSSWHFFFVISLYRFFVLSHVINISHCMYWGCMTRHWDFLVLILDQRSQNARGHSACKSSRWPYPFISHWRYQLIGAWHEVLSHMFRQRLHTADVVQTISGVIVMSCSKEQGIHIIDWLYVQ